MGHSIPEFVLYGRGIFLGNCSISHVNPMSQRARAPDGIYNWVALACSSANESQLWEYDHLKCFSFNSEWFDPTAKIRRKFILNYYPADETVGMWDSVANKKFLKRTKATLDSEDFFVGNRITLHGRPIYIVSYANDFTRNYFSSRLTVTFALIKPDAVAHIGSILRIINFSGFRLIRLKMARITSEHAREFYNQYDPDDQMLPMLVNLLTSGNSVGMILAGQNAIKEFIKLAGPDDPAEAKDNFPCSLRALYGTNTLKNAIHESKNQTDFDRESNLFFSKDLINGIRNTVQLKNSTLCIVKPHAVQDGLTGSIIQHIQKSNFEVVAMQMFYLDKVNAMEYLDVYRNLHIDYPKMVSSLIEGPLIAMEVVCRDGNPNVVTLFKEACGPTIPKRARQIKPWTLRAVFGLTRIFNAIHCTELPCDGILEVCYFFKILEDLTY